MERLNKGKVSIVVPVYKAEKAIRRCVDSILAQTYSNFELLLIDDGSPDQSGKMCDEYAQLDSRVRVFHKENGGVSSARNLGIDSATGTFLVFVDSDDYVTKDYLLHMLQVESSQFVIGGFARKFGSKEDYLSYNSKHVILKKELGLVWSDIGKCFLYIYPFAKLFCMMLYERVK